MSIKKIKYCNGHSEQKEKDGVCCQHHEAQVAAEQQTYEHTIRTPHTGSSIVGIIKNERR